ncbi:MULTISPECIES: PQQ-binding-like beta-propeller repeat protein [Haloferax]|uniref:PQQ-binding-like beta-propeller repeat protein n=1 Tax=Haloferax TaxID=2251 RepID=UPI000B7D911D|nr:MULTISPECIES: PQQ-binding-like beta-propeller repeat protein [Haloferax]MDS0241782.1 PQQ-like beta-propeller repeat protein [Haloferax sp. S2CR25]MDS0444903.1 PQQ-like beta-propeller repeat protein [Haloferax sp. S2CR25-2]
MPSPHRRRFLRACAAAVGLGTAGCLGSEVPAETTTGTEARTETGTETTARTQPTQPDPPVVWRQTVGSEITTPPTSTGDRLYVGTKSGSLESLNTTDGSKQWSYDADTELRGSPAHVGETVFVIVGKNDLFENHGVVALNAETGTVEWTFSPEAWWLEILGVTEDVLYVGTEDDAIEEAGQTLYALSVADGAERWSGEIGDPSGGLLTAETIYVPTYGRLYAYDTATGEQRWTAAVEDYSYQTIAATDETVCFVADEGDTRGKLIALDSETGEETWSRDDWVATSTTLHGDTLYVGGQHIAAFDPESGEKQWQAAESGFVPRVPVQDDVLFAGGGTVRAFDTEGGTLSWTWTPNEGVEGVVPSVTIGDSLYVDSWGRDDPRNRFKFALDVSAGEKQWAFEDGSQLTDLSADSNHVYVGSAKGTVYSLQ